MRVRNDGSIQSRATPTWQNAGRKEDNGLYRCMVTKVVYVDDPANITANSSNPRVLYDVVVLGGFASGQIISNCRLGSDLAGNDSYWERVLRASSKDVSKSRLSDCDGDVVLVQFIQGHTGYPFIVSLDQGINTVASLGARKSEGPYSVRQYNGVKEEITKDGELIQTVRGGTADSDKGSFKPASTPLVTTSTTKEEKIVRTFKSGLTIIEDGKNDAINISTAGGVAIQMDGKTGKVTITKGSTILEFDGAADKISLKSGFVDLGASVSDFAVLFTELLTAFNTHTHNAPQAPAGVLPTTPPLAPMLQTVGSQTVKVQP